MSGVGGIDPKARKRDRRARKGGAAANGTANFAQKMQSAITELEGGCRQLERADSTNAAQRRVAPLRSSTLRVVRYVMNQLFWSVCSGDFEG